MPAPLTVMKVCHCILENLYFAYWYMSIWAIYSLCYFHLQVCRRQTFGYYILFFFFSRRQASGSAARVMCGTRLTPFSVLRASSQTRLWGPGKSTVGVDFVKRWYVVHNDLWKRQVCCLTQNWHYTVSFAMKPLASVWSLWHRWI